MLTRVNKITQGELLPPWFFASILPASN
ncbi:protein of unknown function [Methylococcus capsulatus]|uniref:Uncharacterized protein n=1 Tax=Methylococcus capsulatus TaxID=414 RepID=A0AA35UJY3_METCP|nr:protein of unknown function [Methylococcus capsulatus]